jgi:hypothetical protein
MHHIWKRAGKTVHDMEQCIKDFVKRTTQKINDPDKLLTRRLSSRRRMMAYNDIHGPIRKTAHRHTIQDQESGQSIYV